MVPDDGMLVIFGPQDGVVKLAGMQEQVPALRMIGLYKAFRETVAVDHVDLTVPSGSFFGLVGPNGAGKTTALSMAV